MSTRTKKDWRGRETLSAKMTGVSPQQVSEATGAAQDAWDRGLLAHVYQPSALVQLEPGGLSEALDAIMQIGWVLHSSALGARTVGPNSQQALFVFTRPAALPR